MKKKNFTRQRGGVRLSKNIVPIEYEIQLKPDLDNFTFEGVETITLDILKATKTLTLHSKEIEIETVRVGEVFGQVSYNEKAETATFVFPKNLEVLPPSGGRTSKLTIVFKGILNDKMRGFYRSRYFIGDKEYHMATTQFEATDARRAFPCFDEPAQKAVFHVSLIVPKGKTAISNTLPVSVCEHDGLVLGAELPSGSSAPKTHEIVKFSPTPKMSTYLLAFIIGDFEYLEGKTTPARHRFAQAKAGGPNPSLKRRGGIKVRVFTTPGKKHQAGFALECAVKTLEFYDKYFDIAYPLPVLDMIAIPDFSSGAMENWGAITYRESALLVDETHSSLGNKQWIALIIAHEIAHQWFGNLVTMEWWTHLWLNEGFASYIEYLAVDKLFPKWDIWTQFSTNEFGVALRLDALLNTHPIEIPVHHPSEIGEIFDEVSYSKGAAVIRMLADYLGEKDFRDGLRHYLKKHSYKNTETFHLWEAFEKVSKKPVAKIMRNWTSKPGYPVVKASLVKGKINFSQSRFFASPISAKKTKGRTKWEIPITFKKNKVNFGEAGFYRTAYSRELLEKLKMLVEKKLLSARDRLGIIRDLFALAEAGTIPTTDALEFLSAYKKEDNYTVWLELAMGLGRLEQILAKENCRENLNSLILKLFSPVFVRLGWAPRKNELHSDTLLRSLVLSKLGRAHHKEILTMAKKKFTAGKINPDIRGAVYVTVATNGGVKEYNTFLKMYKTEKLHEEKNRIGGALGDFRDQKILKLACEFALSQNVRKQDTIGIISSVGANPLGRDIWLNFVQKNWKTLVYRYGDGGHTLQRLVKAISGSAEIRHLKSFKKFFSTHDAPGAKRAIQQVIERLEGNVAWLKRDGKKIEEFLK